MLLEKYEPSSLKEFLGNKAQLKMILDWLSKWEKGGALLIYGPCGVGKSLSIKLLAKQLSLELVESYASDNRSSQAIKDSLLKAAKQKSMFYKGKVLVIDDAETLVVKPIIELIQKSEYPVIIIAGSYNKKLRLLHNFCTLVRFEKVNKDEVEDYLKKISFSEKLQADFRTIRRIASQCNGDVRAALLDLEALSADLRDYEENIFNVIRTIFKTKSIASAREAAERTSDDVVAWLEENIANEYRGIEEIAKAYEYLAKADLFTARIAKRQSWNLQKYSSLAVIGVAMSKKRVYLNSSYSTPLRLHNDERTLEKIGAALRVSKKKARDYVFLVKTLIKKDPAMAEKFDFDEEDIQFMAM